MKLSFSTNGWNLPFKKIISLCAENKIYGVEIHDVNAESFKSEKPFTAENIAKTRKFLFENGVNVSCVDVAQNVADENIFDSVKKAVLKAVSVAKSLDCKLVRLHAFKTQKMQNSREYYDAYVKKIMPEFIEKATEEGITLLMESMGIYAATEDLKNLLNSFASDTFSALWDIHHTHRYANESAETSVENLGKHIKHLHVKDSEVVNGEIQYRLLGEGDLNVKSVFAGLRSVNYEGYISLELLPEWLESLGDAEIVLPQFSGYMSAYDSVPDWQNTLFDNNRKTGKYIWKKEILIERTFSQVLDRVVEEFPDQIAFKYTTLDYTRTYSEFRDEVDVAARALMAIGVKKGDHVAMWATNVPEWYITFWATVKIGAVLVTVNTAYKIHEAEYLLKQSDTHTLVLIKGWRDSDYQGIINELCPELKTLKKGEQLHSARLPFLRNVVTVDFAQEGAMTFAEMMQRAKEVSYEDMITVANSVDVNDVCNMQYTSGTTGFPKGVMLTHYNIVNNGKCIGDRMDLSTADRMMIQVPMFHCFGMVLAMTASVTHGVSIRPLPYFSPKPALSCINSERITCFHGVPTMFIAMLAHEDFAKTDFSYMRTGIMAGSPCPVAVMQEVVDKMNMKEITIVYGQTEASPGCTMSSTDDSIEVRVNTVGRPLPNIECKIVNPETNEELPVGEPGEFVARGYNLMKGYYKMAKATAAAIDSEGWLHTGDIALKTPEGNYRITGRLKDMIIRGGENLYPKEIEDFLYTYPKVSDVQVVGVPDQKYGEEAYAFIIAKDGESITEAELRDYCVKHIAKHKVPRYFDFVQSFPTNAAGKILKYKMREDAAEKIKSGKVGAKS
ncbi:MAG: AMP-binding protein [Clostridia bacterium]|nr:AMP-binding protein [Clostridia bacterium]